MAEQFSEHILQMLKLGQSTLKDNPQLTEETGLTNAKGDKYIAMDVKLVKGAGGLVVNHHGVDLAEESFDPEKTYQIIAGCPNIVEFTLSYLR
ncbi:MAG: hypothetical protein HYT83_04180 [Candidatus Levybacteria bacterium]|nr:hypothetical protein [Candidatus Levybacteria bacterium]